ncbi:Long chain acyl-CoA synthetase 4 [Porphyridium purpureum]|uniref:Long chain acyl-CoA synthetase 4 n=1 Tax=Porphyridium purpureum TaxID=35688 RepID=A0A5J4Z5X2_PORPP|nr:Long chain acyl-CoA synthetase 4 [Porphyridium purpureum]|eukprot:POR6815..scf295_1
MAASMARTYSRQRNAADKYADGQTPIRVSTLLDNEGGGHMLAESGGWTGELAIEKLHDVLRNAVSKYPDQPLFGVLDKTASQYSYSSFAEAYNRINRLMFAMKSQLGIKPGDKVGIFSKNCAEWQLVMLATNALGAIVVALYDNLPDEHIAFVANHSGVKVIFAGQSNFKKLGEVAESCENLECVVRLSAPPGSEESTAPLKMGSLNVLSMEQLEETCAKVTQEEVEKEIHAGSKEDLAQIMYTSGTTGDPKGAMITNGNMIAEIAGLAKFSSVARLNAGPGDISFSFLPLAHIFEQVVELAYMSVGCAIAFSSGNMKAFQKELALAAPTILPAVPRVLSRFESGVRAQVAKAGFVMKNVFEWALQKQLGYIKEGGTKNRSHLLDRFVFSSIKAKAMPRIRCFFSGAAPLPAETRSFLECVFISTVLEGFGATETTGGIAVTDPEYNVTGSVGYLLPVCEARLRDIPEMDYYGTDEPYPRGELLVRGSVITTGYYQDEKQTAENMTEDGFFCTGDVASFAENGVLRIVDRKKNITKLSHGDYVAIEKVENQYARSEYVGQLWVYGDSSRPHLIAVVVPSGQARKEIAGGDPEGFFLKEFASIHKQNNMQPAEKIPKLFVDMTEERDELGQVFTVENGCMTPSMKLKRPGLKKRYKEQIQALYAEKKEK